MPVVYRRSGVLRTWADFNELNTMLDDLVSVVYFKDHMRQDLFAQARE